MQNGIPLIELESFNLVLGQYKASPLLARASACSASLMQAYELKVARDEWPGTRAWWLGNRRRISPCPGMTWI